MLTFEFGELVYVGYERDQLFCCFVDNSQGSVIDNSTQIAWDPSSNDLAKLDQFYGDDDSICANLTFYHAYEGFLSCSHYYWGGEISLSQKITAEIPPEGYFCPNSSDTILVWTETLSYPDRIVTSTQSCFAGYNGTAKRNCSRSDNNEGVWHTTNYVECFSPDSMQASCFHPTALLSNADLVLPCLKEMADYFQNVSSNAQPGDVKKALDLLNSILLVTQNSQTEILDLEYALEFFDAFLNLNIQVLQQTNQFIWGQMQLFTDYSYNSSFEMMNDFSNYFIRNWPALNSTEVLKLNSKYSFTLFKSESSNLSTIYTYNNSVKAEFGRVTEVVLIYLNSEETNNFAIFEDGINFMPFLVFLHSNNIGRFRLTFEKLPEHSNFNPICVQRRDNSWSSDNCVSKYNSIFIYCECQNTNEPIFAVILEEKPVTEEPIIYTQVIIVPKWLQIIEIIFCILTIFAFAGVLYLLLRNFKPRNGRTFILCQLCGSQIVSLLIYITFFASEVQISPTFCATISVFLKFFTVYSFLWLSYEARYSRHRMRRKVLKASGESAEVADRLLGNPKKVFRSLTIIVLVISIIITAITEVVKTIFDDSYPPIFLGSICQIRRSQALTHLFSAGASTIFAVVHYMILLGNIKFKLKEEQYAHFRKSFYKLFRVSAKWAIGLLYPCVLSVHGLQLLSTFEIKHDLLSCIWCVMILLIPFIIIGYMRSIRRVSKKVKLNLRQNFTDINQNDGVADDSTDMNGDNADHEAEVDQVDQLAELEAENQSQEMHQEDRTVENDHETQVAENVGENLLSEDNQEYQLGENEQRGLAENGTGFELGENEANSQPQTPVEVHFIKNETFQSVDNLSS